MIGRIQRCLNIVYDNVIGRKALKIPVDQNKRNIPFLKLDYGILATVGRSDDKPIDLPGSQKIQYLFELHVIFIRGAKDHGIVFCVRLVFYRTG